MYRSTSAPGKNPFRPGRAGWPLIALLLTFALNPSTLRAQTSSESSGGGQTIEMLLKRIDQLEARVAQLEGASATVTPNTVNSSATPQPKPPSVVPTAGPSSAMAREGAAPQSETETDQQMGTSTEPERMDVSKTLLRIRGFGDINLHGSNRKGDTTSFGLGQLNLFVTSDVSEKFRFLGEIVFEAGPDNIYGTRVGTTNAFGVDIERLVLQYSHNDYFNLAVGRYHTAIGYYNTAYHHSTWFQTTTGRPFLFQFEDQGGILPIHSVGASASGVIPSGKLGLHYVAEVGNGRASRAPLAEEPVQNELDDQNHKAFNLALFARPEAMRGLQTGFSIYRDYLAPIGQPRVGETILAVHAVYIRPNFEWLNEGVLIRHAPQGLSYAYETPGFYTQVSRRWGSYRPYFRYQYVNTPRREPIFPDVGRQQGPSVGVRYDASEFVALKLQYDYTSIRNQQAISALALQLGFTF